MLRWTGLHGLRNGGDKLNPKIKTLDDLLRVNAEIESRPRPEPERNESVPLPADKKNSIAFLPPDSIRAFKNHPFHLYEGERLDDLVASVKANGILTPAIVRKTEPDENGCEYEMLAGHNRQHAAQLAGLETMPCEIKSNSAGTVEEKTVTWEIEDLTAENSIEIVSGVVARLIYCMVRLQAAEEQAAQYKKRAKNAVIFYIIAEYPSGSIMIQ